MERGVGEVVVAGRWRSRFRNLSFPAEVVAVAVAEAVVVAAERVAAVDMDRLPCSSSTRHRSSPVAGLNPVRVAQVGPAEMVARSAPVVVRERAQDLAEARAVVVTAEPVETVAPVVGGRAAPEAQATASTKWAPLLQRFRMPCL
jgi:hypothetical protein